MTFDEFAGLYCAVHRKVKPAALRQSLVACVKPQTTGFALIQASGRATSAYGKRFIVPYGPSHTFHTLDVGHFLRSPLTSEPCEIVANMTTEELNHETTPDDLPIASD